MVTGIRPLAAAGAIAADRLVGEPPASLHPVAAFGRVMAAAERGIYRDDRFAGVAYALGGIALAAGSGAALRRIVRPAMATFVAAEVAIAGRMLAASAAAIGAALERGDLEGARALLPTLVGRDPSALDASEVARAVVESVAENSVDAIVAPVLWGTVAGGVGALTYRAINTMDAMVGHHSDRFEQFGWASARLDDLVNWLPARVAAALVVLLRPRRAREVWRAVRVDAPRHPSPNAGVVEAAFAGALDLRLGGVNRYGDRVEERAALGRGRTPTARDIAAAVRLSHQLAGAMIAGLAIAAAAPCVVRRLKEG